VDAQTQNSVFQILVVVFLGLIVVLLLRMNDRL
jgi:hypothetical protein